MRYRIKCLPYYLRVLPKKLRLAFQCVNGPYFRWVPPGHFYSPFPDMNELAQRSAKVYGLPSSSLGGIDLRTEAQEELLTEFAAYRTSPSMDREYNPSARYFWPNPSFPAQDAFVLHAMIRKFRPRRFIEVGCGYSSCAILDTIESQKLETELTFIEPYPDVLLKQVRAADHSRFQLKQAFIQDVPLDVFTALEANDILFIDTSHTSKPGGDVNHIFFEILPVLKPGVIVHFHDIWYPFEYPIEWLKGGTFWTEAYLLRAFLMFNSTFKILFFNSYLNKCLTQRVRTEFPLFIENPGASLWLQRSGD